MLYCIEKASLKNQALNVSVGQVPSASGVTSSKSSPQPGSGGSKGGSSNIQFMPSLDVVTSDSPTFLIITDPSFRFREVTGIWYTPVPSFAEKYTLCLKFQPAPKPFFSAEAVVSMIQYFEPAPVSFTTSSLPETSRENI